MGTSVGQQVEASGPEPTLLPPVATVGRRIWRRIIGVLGLLAAVFWNFFWLVGLAWMYDSSTGARFADSVGRLVFLQFGVLVLGFILCLVGSALTLRLATICAAVVLVLALGVGVIGAQAGDHWVFGAMFAIPDIFLVAGIAAMNPRTRAKYF